jgi:hypothetical protein
MTTRENHAWHIIAALVVFAALAAAVVLTEM